ncbi:hypothetical protein G4G27_09945 [Sphingomonas sp. So64.6b]|uniref:hypothetical protein n=1 Tax=Sphingomonas sp. So64.6b TaxID=2997354 RepID=UPI0015FF6CC9|nr:hypothetical protein [Sphingomonas sp. So64.6b]QNA84272.1 hypothetical protein G4G27_09945 [Sphingomonas sp. So64.6b]
MTKRIHLNRLSPGVRQASAAIAIAASLMLAGCNPKAATEDKAAYQLPDLPATLPLAAGDATTIRPAAAIASLPKARPIRAVQLADPGQSYAYADDAWGFADALGDAPPDYGFDYDDVEPWAWQGYDDSIAFAEPIDDGYRYYYYRPGADSPYFVRDGDYGYGYDDGQLAVVYAAGGGVLPYASYGPRQDYAARYYERGRNLYRSSRQRRPVIAANWAERRDAIAVARARWSAERSREADWQRYHAGVEQRQQRHWGQEQVRRRADIVRYDTWRDQRFRTPPPPRAIPAAWTQAPWARDANRYAPAARGFAGDRAEQQRAVAIERRRVATLAARPVNPRDEVRRAAIDRQRALGQQQENLRLAGRGNADQQRLQAQRQAEMARRQGERARQVAAGDAAQRDQQARAAAMQQRRATLERDRSVQAAQQARRIQAQNDQQARVVQVRQRQQAQLQARAAQRTQVEQRRQGQARAAEAQQRRQRLAQTQTQQRQQGQARAAQAQQRQAQIQQRAVQAQQRLAAQGQARAAQAQQRQQAQTRAMQAQQRQAAQGQARAAQAQQRQQAQARAMQAQQRQAAQGQARAAQAQQRQQAQVQAQQRQQAQGQARAAQAQRQQVQAQARAAQMQARAAQMQARVAARPVPAARPAGPLRPDRGRDR